MVKKNKIKKEISNRLLYTLITIGILAILGFGVYALTPGVAPNPGHLISDIAPPSGCGGGQFLQWTNGSSWACANAGGGSGSQWTPSGNDIYYSNGNVGIGGTPNQSARLNVTGVANVGELIAYKNVIIGGSTYSTSNIGLYVEGTNGDLLGSTAYIQGNNPNNGAALYAVNGYGGNVGKGISGWGSTGVYGYSNSNNGIGVEGLSTNIGVEGVGNNFDFYANGAGTNYGSPSSIRWKNNIQPINNALNIVMNLNGVSFNWDKAHGGKYDIGFIGEQVGQYLPEIVQFDPNSSNPNYYVTGMDYSKITPVLLEAIKEQQNQIDSLKLEVDQLKNK